MQSDQASQHSPHIGAAETPLHIAMFTDFHPNTLGGIATAVEDHRRELVRRGHRVTVIAPTDAADPADPAEPADVAVQGDSRTQGNETQSTESEDISCDSVDAALPWLVTLEPWHGISVNGFPLILPTTRSSAVVASELSRRGPIDVIHIHTTYGLAILGARFASQQRIPMVQSMHSRDDAFVEQNVRGALPVSLLLRFLHRLALSEGGDIPRQPESRTAHHVWCTMIAQARAADAVIAPTHHFAARLRGHGLVTPISVISNGIDDHTLADVPSIPPRAPRAGALRLIWCGRLSAEKRPEIAVDAVASTSGCTLDIFGDGDEYERLTQRIASTNTADRISLRGRWPRHQILAAMTQADAVVFTSHDFDTQGLVLLEAAAAGLPMICCDPALRETIPPGGGFITDSPDSRGVAALLADLSEHPERLAAARDALTGAATPQSAVTAEIVALYRELISPAGRRPVSLPATIDQVPVAPGKIPILGHSLTALRRGLRFINDLGRLGPVVRLDLGTRPAYLVTTPDLVRQIGFRTADEFHRDDLAEAMHEAIREAFNVLHGPRHELRRRQIAPALRQRRLSRYALTTATIANRWARDLPTHKRIDLKPQAHGLVLEAVTSTLFRADFGRSALHQIREVVPWLLGEVIVRGALPPRVRRLRVRANRRFARESEQLRGAIREVVIRYRSDQLDHDDVLSTLVGHTDPESGLALTDDEIIDELLLMVAAGVGSTASILAWVWCETARNPDVSAHVAHEVRSVVGDGEVRSDHIAELPYLRSVVSETLRMWGPWISSQTADGPVTFGDSDTGRLTVPDGSTFIYSPYQILHDSHYYPNPETFDPDRWAPGRAEQIDKRANLAFGVGERHCPGNNFAMSTILLSTAGLYSRYTPELDDRRPVRASTTDFVASPSRVLARLHPVT